MIDIRGPNVFKGYWRMPGKTKEEFREDGFFISGDLGRVDERGYISVVGRAKDLIITPKPGASLEEKAIQVALLNELAKFKQPKRVFITNELPRNAMGKIQKKELRDQYANAFAG